MGFMLISLNEFFKPNYFWILFGTLKICSPGEVRNLFAHVPMNCECSPKNRKETSYFSRAHLQLADSVKIHQIYLALLVSLDLCYAIVSLLG
uniref:Uncharacterized protein n=1 Tax=Rhizophora mucronata TaxID=61149 RepID=A0A2P2NSC7_RHIMU